jgi:starch-binding outer membrane protein, SusD/RagB family
MKRIMTRCPQARAAVWLALVPLGAAACDSVLEVQAPSRVNAEDLDNPAYASLLVKSAIGDFECALASYITTVSQVTEEFKSVNIYSAEASDYDRRTVNAARSQYASFECGGFGAIYQPLSTAIWQADNALQKLETFTDQQVADRAALMQQAQAFGGYGRVLLGESFCSAAINLSAELTPETILKQAEDLFTSAIAGPNSAVKNLALVGRARARLDQGDAAGALTDAQLVPAGFVYNARYSDASGRAYNEIFNRNNRLYGVSVEGPSQNPAWKDVADPRVRAVKTGDLAPNGIDTVWIQQKYLSLTTPIPIARSEEAALIIAEVTGGQTAVEIINQLHAKAGLPSFESVDPTEIRNHVIEERARELFLEGHRFHDVKRFNLPLAPAAGTPYWQGGSYGDMRCFPLPDLERSNNPNIGR